MLSIKTLIEQVSLKTDESEKVPSPALLRFGNQIYFHKLLHLNGLELAHATELEN